MFIRMGSFHVRPGSLDSLRRTYETECVPLVKRAEGNLDAYLLEPVDAAAPFVVFTIWRAEDDAVRYEASGTAQQVVALVREHFAGPPTLASYRVMRS